MCATLEQWKSYTDGYLRVKDTFHVYNIPPGSVITLRDLNDSLAPHDGNAPWSSGGRRRSNSNRLSNAEFAILSVQRKVAEKEVAEANAEEAAAREKWWRRRRRHQDSQQGEMDVVTDEPTGAQPHVAVQSVRLPCSNVRRRGAEPLSEEGEIATDGECEQSALPAQAAVDFSALQIASSPTETGCPPGSGSHGSDGAAAVAAATPSTPVVRASSVPIPTSGEDSMMVAPKRKADFGDDDAEHQHKRATTDPGRAVPTVEDSRPPPAVSPPPAAAAAPAPSVQRPNKPARPRFGGTDEVGNPYAAVTDPYLCAPRLTSDSLRSLHASLLGTASGSRMGDPTRRSCSPPRSLHGPGPAPEGHARMVAPINRQLQALGGGFSFTPGFGGAAQQQEQNKSRFGGGEINFEYNEDDDDETSSDGEPNPTGKRKGGLRKAKLPLAKQRTGSTNVTGISRKRPPIYFDISVRFQQAPLRSEVPTGQSATGIRPMADLSALRRGR